MIWGGLHPVRSRFILDVCAILSLSYCCYLTSSYCRSDGGVDDNDGTENSNDKNGDLSSILLWKSGIFFGTIVTLKGQITHRWPLTFPMMCIMMVQFFRLGLFLFLSSGIVDEEGMDDKIHKINWWRWLSVGFDTSCGIMVFISASLLVLFPAVKLSRPIAGGSGGESKQIYNVGVVDLYLPIQKQDGDGKRDEEGGKEFLTARLLYPTAKKGSFFETAIPHLNPSSSNMICNAMMQFAGPPPIRKFGWMLHTWCLANIPMIRNAKPIDNLSYVKYNDGTTNKVKNDGNKKGRNDEDKHQNQSEKQQSKLPLVIYSHGLFGNYVTYTYQPLSLAANGYVVLMIDHEDGTAPVMEKHDGSLVYHNLDPYKLFADGREDESVRKRRSQTKHRVSELLYAAQSFLNLNDENIPQLQSHGISFVNRLDVINGITFMGHSFGGASALSAAAERPDLTFCVIAHEPAIDWMTDDARRALFPEKKFAGTRNSYTGGTGGYEEEIKDVGDVEKRREEYMGRSLSSSTSSSLVNRSTLHDVDMLFLYSDQWVKQGWGASKLIECLHKRGELGPKSGVSDYGVIAEACHVEFSDTAMLTPAWLGRATNNLGKRNPHDTAQEIGLRTLVFLDEVKKRHLQRKSCD